MWGLTGGLLGLVLSFPLVQLQFPQGFPLPLAPGLPTALHLSPVCTPKKIPTAVSWFISMLDEGELEQQQSHVRVDFSACSKAQVKQALLQPCGKTA